MKLLKTFILLSLSAGFVLLSTGCATRQILTMRSDLPPIDDSAISPRLKDIPCKKVMIIPPSGSARGTFESKLSLFEREFIRQGMTVISSAITGRVVMDSPDKSQERKNETASNLSDMERALIMAKTTGADVILQLGMFEWSKERILTRFFIAEGTTDGGFKETDLLQYKSWTGAKLEYESLVLSFIGKLVNVENGEVLATISTSMPANYALPQDYRCEFSCSGNNLTYRFGTEGPFSYWTSGMNGREYPWEPQAFMLSETKVIKHVAEKISSVVNQKL
jgi:hypothetical protein